MRGKLSPRDWVICDLLICNLGTCAALHSWEIVGLRFYPSLSCFQRLLFLVDLVVSRGQVVDRRFINLSWDISIGEHFILAIRCFGKSLTNLDFMDSEFRIIYNYVEFDFGKCLCLRCPRGRALDCFYVSFWGQFTFLFCSPLSPKPTFVSARIRY